jgi:hypothetical protein
MNNIGQEIKKWCLARSDKPKNLFVTRLEEGGLSELDISKFLDVLDGICEYCWDASYPCSCSRDE